MDLGNFSVSLAVNDIEASRIFYEKLGFSVFWGEKSQRWLIMKNGEHLIGLFQGILERNSLTFNPGWDTDGANVDEFTDIRELQRQLKSAGVSFVSEVDDAGSGPGSFVITDPDGNPIIIDQHR
jgi:catechol 2,3-dioxygenase-like lactoylglutathione lyase family enzyme